MNTIDRYIARTFLGSYVILLLVGIGLYVFGDILVNLDEVTEHRNLPTAHTLLRIADYHGYRLPLYYSQLGGVAIAIAASFTFAMMLHNNEMTAPVAAGVPLQRLGVPVLACAVILAGLWAVNSEWIVPSYANKIVRRYDELGESRQVEVLCVRDDHNAILSAQELHAQSGWLKGVHIIAPDSEGNPSYLITADTATYDAQRRTWQLGDRGAVLAVGSAFAGGDLGTDLRKEPLAEYAFTLSPEQIRLRQSSQWADLMSIYQMSVLLKSRNLPNLPAIAKALDIRFTQPLLAWILLLLAIPFFLTREPANVFVAGGKALLLAGLCFAFTFMMQSISTEAHYRQLAVALPVLLFGPLAVVHFANVKT